MKLDHPMHRALLVAALYLATATLLHVFQSRHLVDAETSVRMMGMLMGSMVIASANAIPKKLVPLARLSCDPGREQALRRTCGWALVLGGLGYTFAYALAPMDIASKLAICLLAPAVLVVAGIKARCLVRRNAGRGGA